VTPALVLSALALPDSPLATQFATTGGTTIKDWILLFFDNFLSVALLDTPDAFGLRFSSITPRTWFSKLLTAGVKMFIATGIIGIFLQVLEYKETRRFYGTAKECSDFIKSLPDVYQIRIKRIGRIAECDKIEIRPPDFYRA